MEQKKFMERGWKRLLSFMLALVMVFTLLPVGSMKAYADDEGSSSSPSEADYDIKYSEIRANGSGKAYPVGTRILMDIMPKSGTPKEEDAAGFCVDSLETAVFYGYITVDDSIDDSAREYYNSLENELNKVIELKEWYYDYSGKHTIKSGGYWIFNKNNEKGSGDEFYGVVASSEKEGSSDIKVPTDKLDIVGSPKHTHQWNYILSEDGKTITANCTNADGNCDYRDTTALTYSIEVGNKTYSGNAYDGVSVTDKITSVTGNEPITKYYLADGTTLTTAENSGATTDGGAPVNAGSYVVKTTIGEATASAGFEIKAVVGSGTEADPYIISSSADLSGMLSQGTEGKFYKLSDDFDNTEEITSPIEDFKGTFDGNGKTLKLNINEDYYPAGLFDQNYGTISDITVEGTVIGNEKVGGICGSNGGTITGCINKAAVSGSQYVGGIAGKNEPQGNIINCQNYGNIIADIMYAGSIAGKNGSYSADATVENCKNQGNVTCNVYKNYTGYADSQMAYLNVVGNHYRVIGKVGNAWNQIHYEDAPFNIQTNDTKDELSVSLEPEIVSGGKLLKFTVSITNKTVDVVSEAKIAVLGDTELSGCDRSTNKTNDNQSIMTMSFNGISFMAFSKDEDFKIVNTDNSNCSIDAPPVNEKCDSAYSAQWNIASIAGGETLTRTFYMGCVEGENLSDADLNKIVNSAVHTHDWKYSVSGKKLEAYCAAEGCTSETSETNKKTFTITASDSTYSGHAYDGLNSIVAEISDFTGQTPSVTYTGRGTTAYEESKTAPTNAGTYTANVTIGDKIISTDFTINKRVAEIIWSKNPTYNGSEQTVTATVSNAADGDSFNITCTGNSGTNVGDSYTAKVTDLGNDNYTLEGSENAEQKWSIDYLKTDAKVNIADEADGTNGWYKKDVTVNAPDGYKISEDGKTWTDSLSYNEDGQYTKGYYLKNSDGYIAKQELTFKIDKTAPTGSVKIGTKDFTGILDNITFGYFIKDSVDITITGNDKTSGISKVEYQKVAKGQTYDVAREWTTGTSFKMTANDKYAIYVRLTDEAGNQSIINSDGIVVYTDATASDSIEHTIYSDDDAVSDIKLNGNTVKSVSCGDKTLSKGTDYDIVDDKIVFKNAYLKTLSAGNYEFTVSYNPAGEIFDSDKSEGADASDSIITLAVKKLSGEAAETNITNADKISKTYDGKQAAQIESSSNSKGTPKVEYKKKGADDKTYSETVPSNAGEYTVRVTYPEDENYAESTAESDFTISRAEAVLTVKNAVKHAGKADPEYTYDVTGLIGADRLSGITFSREKGEQAGKYKVTATVNAEADPNYNVKVAGGELTIEDHVKAETPVEENRIEPTCTKEGSYDEVYYCTVDGCKAELERIHKTIPAAGHKWSDWKVTKEATATEEGKKESTCTVCGQKKYDVIPVKGTTEDDITDGTFEKEVQVAADASVKEAAMTNSKSELLEDSKIFSDAEKAEIKDNGADAKVWLEISKTDESKIPEDVKAKVEDKAKEIMGDKADKLTYFDADLFKQVSSTDGNIITPKTAISEPGKAINITLKIPDSLRETENTATEVRIYKLIRIHTNADGTVSVEAIDGEYNEESGEFSTSSDKFSTYAIVYSDVPVTVSFPKDDEADKPLTSAGEKRKLTAEITPDSAADRTIKWTSSNPSVATVDENGVVTAVADGTATITATVGENGPSADYTIKVEIKEKSSDEKPSESKPSDGKPSGSESSESKPSDSKPSDNKTDENVSDGNVSDGNKTDESKTDNNLTEENKTTASDTADTNADSKKTSQPAASKAKTAAPKADTANKNDTKKKAKNTGDNNAAWPFVVTMFAGVTLAAFGRKKKENR